jgi:hypothetical protein
MSIKNTEESFWKNVDIKSEDECWEWKKCKNKDGYGVFGYQGKTNLAHRLSYAFTHNVSVGGLDEIRHTCDNPGCCNPSHLINGTHLENLQDMKMKGRIAKGEQSGNAKLTEKEVLEIRKRYTNGERQKILATDYGVGECNISDIVNRQRWGWLNG